VGVIRERAGLELALSVIEEVAGQAGGDVMLANMALTAKLIASCSLARHESRGGHWRSDYPAANPALAHRSFVRVTASGAIEALVAGPASRRNPNPVLVSLA
jgi:L-aspartate oxidase